MLVVTLALADRELRLRAPSLHESRPHAPAHTEALRDLARRYEHAAATGREIDLLDIGRALAGWLDDTFANALTRILEDVNPPLVLEVRVPRRVDEHARALLDAPWELLADAAGFLVADRHVRLTPLRRLGAVSADPTPTPPRPGALTVLFMAASPRGVSEFDLEAAESEILAATKDLALDLFVEETGTARELGVRAVQLDSPEHPLHVVHVTCHGQHEPEPAMALEDERGELDRATSETLYGALGELGSRLGLLLLSACSTAATSSKNPTDSLVIDLVRSGIPAALGWSAPVGVTAASDFASALFDKLGKGTSLEIAVGEARRALLVDGSTPSPFWHMARLVLGPKGGGPLATGKGERRKAGAIHKHFLGNDRRIPVAGPDEFVGRRRTLQACIRALRDVEKVGVLVHGTGGLGKSSLAARVVDRMSDHLAVVVYGRFGHGELVKSLADAVGPHAAKWRDAWWSKDGETGDAVRALLASGLPKPLLLVLDDFEQMLEGRADRLHVVHAGAVERVRGIVNAFVNGSGRSRLLITSRFDFELFDRVGKDLAGELVRVPVPSFSKREETKRLVRVSGVSEELRQRCARASYGNPALLSLLLRRAESDGAGCVALLEQIEGQTALADAELVERVAHLAVESVIAALNVGERELLRLSLVFGQVPMPLELARALGQAATPAVDDDGSRLVALGAWDVFPDVGDPERPAVVANRMVAEWLRRGGMTSPSAEERSAVARAVGPGLRRLWVGILGRVEDDGCMLAGSLSYDFTRAVGDVEGAREFARLAVHWRARTLAPEPARAFVKGLVKELGGLSSLHDGLMLRDVATLHELGEDGDFWVACLERALACSETLTASGRGPIHFDVATARIRQGQLDEAREHLDRALKSFEEVGDVRSRAVTLGKVADIHFARGQLDEALHIRQQEQLPVYERLGDVRSRAVALGKVAEILEARGQPDEALHILQQVLLPIYERLGDVHSRAFTLGQVADILEARGQLDEAFRIRHQEQLPVFEQVGDVHSRAVTLGQVAHILKARGQFNEALHILQQEVLPSFERIGDVRLCAVTFGQVADILQAHGQLDDALRIIEQEEIPVYELIGDVRSRAVALGQVADILHVRGQLDEALQILQQELLPTFERIGDVRSLAVTLGKVADVLRTRGQLDEALRIRQREQLPIFERIGDIRSRAVTLGKVADILQTRGQLDEALRIRQQEEVPVYECLGDVRERAVTVGKIADILQSRGELDKALHIRQQEELPVYERLGDVRERAHTLGKVADILQSLGQFDEALRMRQQEQLPVYERLGDVRECANTLGKVADVLEARGQFDEALRIRQQEQLPVYERLSDVRSLLVARTNLALNLLRRGRREDVGQVVSLLAAALADARRLRIPEAAQIETIIRSMGRDPNQPPFT